MVRIRRDNDPFKKYWWVLLIGFGLTGLWLLVPLMGQTGTSHVSFPKQTAVDEQGLQSLDSQQNPSGAPGSVIDLSMDGALTGKKKEAEGPAGSSLYQAPETAAPGAPIVAQAAGKAPASASAGAPNLAAELKKVSKGDSKGWGGAKPQRGFTAPKAGFGGFSAGGSSSGSGASLSASPFNAPTANVSVGEAQGPDSSAGGMKVSDRRAFMQSLAAAQAKSAAAAKIVNADGSKSSAGQVFDGSQATRKTISGGGSGGLVYGQMDYTAAASNLKDFASGKDPKIDDDKLPSLGDVKGKDAKGKMTDMMGDQMGQMVMMMAVGGIANSVMGPTAGAMVTMMLMQSMQMAKQSSMDKDK